MILDTQEYADVLGIDAAAVRMRISRAKGEAAAAGLIGLLAARKKGNGWIFIVDAKIIEKETGKKLPSSEM